MNVQNPTATLKIRKGKNEGSREKWTPNSLNINVNSPNLLRICGYKLPITGQNLTHKGLAQAKVLLRGYVGLLFDLPCIRRVTSLIVLCGLICLI